MSVPFTRDWSATTDASGNATISLVPFAAYWSNFIVAGQVAGNPIWTVFKNGSFLLPGAGAQVALGPVVFGPQDQLKIRIAGATPGSTVAGTLWGDQSTTGDGSDLLATLPSVSGSIPTFQPPESIFTAAADGTVHGPTTVPIPQGAQSLVLLMTAVPANVTTLRIVGNVSGEAYYDSAVQLPGAAFGTTVWYTTLLSSYDTMLTITFTAGPAGGGGLYAHVALNSAVVGLQAGSQVQALLYGGDLGKVDTWATSLAWQSGNPYINGLLITQFGSKPAPWQAPYQTVYYDGFAGVGTHTMLAGAAGRTIYVFGWGIEIDSGSSLSIGFLQDSAGNRIAAAASPTTGGLTGNKGGAPLPGGLAAGLVANAAVIGTGAALRFWADVSQA